MKIERLVCENMLNVSPTYYFVVNGGWIDGWMDGWINELMNSPKCNS